MPKEDCTRCLKLVTGRNYHHKSEQPFMDVPGGPVEQPFMDVPGGPVVKNPPVNAGDTGSIPGLGRFYMLQGN